MSNWVKINSISLVNFKNYQEVELTFHPKLNCLVGDNGEGKTNLLDAIYYLTFCKSFLNPIDSQNIKINEDFFLIQGEFERENETSTVYCGIKRNQKKVFKINKKEYEKLADHIGEFPLVIVSPADINLIQEGSDLRRKFLDGILAQYDNQYLELLFQYNKVLSQRNALLKYFFKERTYSKDQIEVWDDQLIHLGQIIGNKRNELAIELIPVFQKYYNKIANAKEVVGLEYQSQILSENFKSLLENNYKEDIQKQYTNIGIHKDDLIFTLAGNPTKKFASQGQQKTYLIALKLAQLEFLKEHKKITPILLLDDIFDKLDENRVGHLLELVNTNDFGQIFLSDTDKERIKRVLTKINSQSIVFEVKDGQVLVEVSAD